MVYLPLWKIWLRQLGWWHSQYMENNPFMFQTTNQQIIFRWTSNETWNPDASVYSLTFTSLTHGHHGPLLLPGPHPNTNRAPVSLKFSPLMNSPKTMLGTLRWAAVPLQNHGFWGSVSCLISGGTSKNTGTNCTCPGSWLSSCNAQLSNLCVECYKITITTTTATTTTTTTSIIIIIISISISISINTNIYRKKKKN